MPSLSEAVAAELSGSSLPPLPHILVELLRVCQDHGANFQDIAAIVAKDAVVTSQLISVANSSYYSRQGNVQTIERALLLLGIDVLKTMVITASVQQMCSGLAVNKKYFKLFWKRSLRCALISRALAHLTGYSSPEEAYLMGLLHNVGELLLAVNHPEHYPELVLAAEGSQSELEVAKFGTSHCELGRCLIEEWGLTSLAADAVAYHHAPLNEVADAHHLTKLIFLASTLAEVPLGEEVAADVIDFSGAEVAERLFGLSGALAREIAAKVAKDVVAIAAALAIDLSDDEHQDVEAARSRLGDQLNRRMVNQEISALFDGQDEGAVVADTIAQTVNIMFGYKNSLLLMFDPAQNTLTYDAEGLGGDSLAIPLASSESLIAQCATAQEVRWSHSQTGVEPSLTVVDRQCIRLCEANSLVCAPIAKGVELIAVLVMGDLCANPPDQVTQSLLQDFSYHVALLLTSRPKSNIDPEINIASMKQKVRAVVHEVNNPLAIVRNYLEALSHSTESESDQSQYRILREEIDRASQILTRLQDIETDASEGSEGLSVNQEIKSLMSVFEKSICKSNNVSCELQLSSKVDKAVLPRNQLRQVITNLVKNAVEAMPSGGKVTVSTGVSVGSRKGSQLEMVIADNGPGIPDEIFNHLFQPGHTTKDGNHSGLGLSISHSLIEELGGSITCQSNNRGTQYRILLPLT